MRAITVAFFIILIMLAALFAHPELVSSRARPTACRPGIDYCGDRLATSVVRPGQRNVPRRETPQPRRAK